jgi:hypothetical protein
MNKTGAAFVILTCCAISACTNLTGGNSMSSPQETLYREQLTRLMSSENVGWLTICVDADADVVSIAKPGAEDNKLTKLTIFAAKPFQALPQDAIPAAGLPIPHGWKVDPEPIQFASDPPPKNSTVVFLIPAEQANTVPSFVHKLFETVFDNGTDYIPQILPYQIIGITTQSTTNKNTPKKQQQH